jgi:prefoldin subunit 5
VAYNHIPNNAQVAERSVEEKINLIAKKIDQLKQEIKELKEMIKPTTLLKVR